MAADPAEQQRIWAKVWKRIVRDLTVELTPAFSALPPGPKERVALFYNTGAKNLHAAREQDIEDAFERLWESVKLELARTGVNAMRRADTAGVSKTWASELNKFVRDRWQEKVKKEVLCAAVFKEVLALPVAEQRKLFPKMQLLILKEEKSKLRGWLSTKEQSTLKKGMGKRVGDAYDTVAKQMRTKK